MSIWRDKVQTTVHPIILNIPSIDSTLIRKELLKLFVNVSRGSAPTLLWINRVPESRSVHHCQSQLHTLLLDFHGLFLNLCGLFDTLLHTGNDPGLVKVTQEETVYKSRFAQSCLAHNHQRKVESPLHGFPVHLLGKGGEPDVVTVLGRWIHFINGGCCCCRWELFSWFSPAEVEILLITKQT